MYKYPYIATGDNPTAKRLTEINKLVSKSSIQAAAWLFSNIAGYVSTIP